MYFCIRFDGNPRSIDRVIELRNRKTLSNMQTRIHARAGSLLLEIVVAAALLSASVVGIAKLAKAQSEVRRRADLRLLAEFLADNQLERLRGRAVVVIEAAIQPVPQIPAGLKVDIQSDAFDLSSARGTHVTVRVFPTASKSADTPQQPLVVRHGWVLTTRAKSNDTDSTAEATP